MAMYHEANGFPCHSDLKQVHDIGLVIQYDSCANQFSHDVCSLMQLVDCPKDQGTEELIRIGRTEIQLVFDNFKER